MNSIKRIAIITATFLGLHLGVASVINVASHVGVDESNGAISEEIGFWNSVATGGSNSPSVENRLARDLAVRLGPVQPGVNELPDEIVDFRGSSNAYGGITEEIGFNPFTNQGCDECGPLNDEALNSLLLIKQDRLGLVVDELEDGIGSTSWRVSDDAPLYVLPLLYGAGAGLMVGLPALPGWWRRRQEEERMRRHFPEQMELIDEIDVLLDTVDDDGSRARLRNDRLRLWNEVAVQSQWGASGMDKVREVEDKIRDSNEFFEARREAKEAFG